MPASGDQRGWELSTAIVMFHEAIARSHGLSAADYKALGAIRRDGPMPLGSLSDSLAVVPSAVTAVVDRLERLGLVERVPDSVDRRRTIVRAMPVAQSRETESYARIAAETAVFLSRLSGPARRAVLDYIDLTTRLVTEETHRILEDG